MNQSRKEFIYLFIPALLTALVYYVQVERKLQAELETVVGPSGQLPSAASTSSKEAQVRRYKQNIADLGKEAAMLKEQKQQHEEKLDSILEPMTDQKRRASALQELYTLLGNHRLQVTEEVSGNINQLPQALRFITGFIKERGTGTPPEIREMRISGGYLDVLAALEELSLKGIQAIPVNLDMHRVESSGDERTWTILIWV